MDRPEVTGSGRVSPTAPDIASPSFRAWQEALSEPATRKALDAGLADIAAGRTRPWAEIRRRRGKSS